MTIGLLPITELWFQVLVIMLTFGMPVFLFLVPARITEKTKLVYVFLYIGVILFITIIGRESHPSQTSKLIPLSSYIRFQDVHIRWQIYMNIFLFIPLGYLIPFASKKTFLQTLVFGCCLSIGIELLQFIFALGLCETDDVIHNTLGCIIGYWYWFGLSKLGEKLHRDRE